MFGTGRVLVSMDTLNRDEAIRDFVDGRLSRAEVATVLGLSERQVSRMIGRWKKKGVLGLEHGLAGKPSNNRLDDEIKARVVDLLKGKYSGFNLLHFHECLVRDEKIEGVSYTSVKRIARGARIGKVKSRRSKIRKKRSRFAQAGYMLQMDGSTHRWWKGQEVCLIAGIDDATSDVPCGEFFRTESLEGYMRVIRRIIELKGIPLIIYVDRASWLGGLSDEASSQFLRICGELGIRVIHAGSPEAKGRIERLWATLQDRLASEFRLHGVNTFETANQYLNETFLKQTWAEKFTVEAKNAKPIYRPSPKGIDLDQIFCLKFDRKIRKDHTLLFGNEVYSIGAELPHSLVRRIAEIRVYPDGKLRGYYGGKDLELKAVRGKAWRRYEEPSLAPGLTTWLRVLGTESQEHSLG